MSQITYHDVSRETFQNTDALIDQYESTLTAYLDRLKWWNKRINLVSRNIANCELWEHLRHSLLISQFSLFQKAKLIVDSGTGGGLPGFPLALTHPGKAFVLNDISTKKCRALQQMCRSLNCENVSVQSGSLNELSPSSHYLLISKHTFKLHEVHNLAPKEDLMGIFLYKGLPVEKELSQLPDRLQVSSYRLDTAIDNDFYTRKALIFLQPG